MRKSLLKLLGVVVGFAFSASVFAVGLGGINVTTALGQRLKADIELVAVENADKGRLVARLAPSSAYKNAGLEYPYGNNFKFEIESRENGQLYIKVSSAQPINDPFVSLLVELSWSSGKLSREYTFLLDPPGYMPEQPAQAGVQAVAPESEAKVLTAPEAVQVPPPSHEQESAPVTLIPPAPYTEQVAPTETAAQATGQVQVQPGGRDGSETSSTDHARQEVSETTSAAPLKQEASVTTSALPEENTGQPAESAEWISVNRGDTLYKLAEQYKLADMNLERLLVAIYRVNASEFDGKNMNRIRAGKVLKLPEQSEYDSVTLAEAQSEIRAQAADWNAYRQKLAGAASVSNQTQIVQQVVTGKINSSVADRTPIAKESAKEVLKLSKGEAPGDQVGAGGKSAQELKNAAQEEAIAKDKAAKEEQMRVAKLEDIRQKEERLAQLKAQAAQPQTQPAQPQVQKPTVAAPVAAQAKKATEEASAAKPKVVKPEPLLTDQILENPVYLAGGVGAILVFGGIGFVLYKRKKKATDEKVADADVGEITGGHMVAPVMPSPDTGDFTRTTVTPSLVSSDTVDPISEADLFLNFGRDAQAEEILKDALKNTPGNHQIHLKLLGIYANRKDANSFASIARQLQDSGDDAAWQQAVEMGRQLEPNNPMYGGSNSMEDTGSSTMQVAAFDVTSAANAPAAALDFDFDAAAASAKTPSSPSPEQDFLGVGDNTMVGEDKEGGMDFDVTASHANADPLADSGEMVFDITGSHASPEEAAQPADDGGMAFTLDFPVEAPKAAPAPATVDLAGISLNFDDETGVNDTSAGEGKSDQWQDVSTKIDLAKAYMEMGDSDGAREILNEVLQEGDAEQQSTAQALFAQLG